VRENSAYAATAQRSGGICGREDNGRKRRRARLLQQAPKMLPREEGASGRSEYASRMKRHSVSRAQIWMRRW